MNFRTILTAILFCLTHNLSFALHEGFVYLQDVDPSIIAELRYAGNDNFLGTVVDGYATVNKVVLTKQAACALAKAQAAFKKHGYSIVVYDAYRPQTAVNNFIRWAAEVNDQINKALFYPRVDKTRVFELGYVAERSGHSRGSTVDISLIKLGNKPHAIKPEKRILLDGFTIEYLNDGTLDMGSSFDLFDVASHGENDVIAAHYKKNRDLLRDIMLQYGFKLYTEEWWHFTLKSEPFPETYFDFPIA